MSSSPDCVWRSLPFWALAAQVRTGTLSIYYVDTEGGQSTLFVGPSGESLLVDTGNAGERDLGRIAETLRTAGVTRIDHLWTTHYHGDHVGALLELAKQFPVGHFYDHGKPHANDRIVSAQFLVRLRGAEQRKAHHRQAGRQGEDARPRHHRGGVGESVHPDEPAGRRQPERVVRRREAERRERIPGSRQWRLGGVRAHLRRLPHDRSRRSYLERRARSDVPDQPDRHGRSLSDVAPRAREVRIAGARPGAAPARGRDEQRHA